MSTKTEELTDLTMSIVVDLDKVVPCGVDGHDAEATWVVRCKRHDCKPDGTNLVLMCDDHHDAINITTWSCTHCGEGKFVLRPYVLSEARL